MRALWILAAKELRDGLRNRWVAATILVLAALALSLAFLGSGPAGTVKASPLSVTVVSLSSLTLYLLPLIALTLSYDALVGELERGTMVLLLTYPVARWQVVLGKFLGHLSILAIAIAVGYGGAGLAIAATGGSDPEGWRAYAAMMASSLLLGAVFVALGYLLSVLARERATAAGLAIALWLAVVVLYDLALLGLLVADQGQLIGQRSFDVLMLANPTDAYRLFNLAGFEAVARAAGLTVGAEAPWGHEALLGVLSAWLAAPLVVTVLLFQRKEI